MHISREPQEESNTGDRSDIAAASTTKPADEQLADPGVIPSAEVQTPPPSINPTNHIVIIDNLKQPWKYRQSPSIKRELSKFFPNIVIRLAYSLRAGGVAFHVNSKKDQDTILNFTWPQEAFDGSGATISCHRDQKEPKVILKNIKRDISERELEERLFQFTATVNKVRRFKYQDTGKPLPVVKVTFQSEKGIELLKSKKLSIEGVNIAVEDYKYLHRREIKCFNCSGTNHIARDCTEPVRDHQ